MVYKFWNTCKTDKMKMTMIVAHTTWGKWVHLWRIIGLIMTGRGSQEMQKKLSENSLLLNHKYAKKLLYIFLFFHYTYFAYTPMASVLNNAKNISQKINSYIASQDTTNKASILKLLSDKLPALQAHQFLTKYRTYVSLWICASTPHWLGDDGYFRSHRWW